MRGLARGLLTDFASAEDVVQGTWVAALERPPRGAAGPAGLGLRAWLGTVARNLVRQRSRVEARRERRELQAARREAVPSAAEVVEREAVRGAVVDAVLALREPSRSAILLRFYEDLPPREIARRLDVPVETVRTRIKRGLAQLRRDLDRRSGGDRRAWGLVLLSFPPPSSRWPRGGLPMSITSALGAKTLPVLLATFAVGGGLAWWATRPPAESAGPAAEVASPAADRRGGAEEASSNPLAAGGQRTAEERRAAEPAADHRVRGRVRDHRRRPVRGAVVLFADGPEAVEREAVADGDAGVVARSATDPEGRFEARFERPRRLFAWLQREVPGYLLDVEGPRGRWVETSMEDVAFDVTAVPTTTVAVRARDATTGEELEGFACRFRRLGDELVRDGRAEGPVLERLLPLPLDADWADWEVRLDDPRATAPPLELRLSHGAREEAVLTFERGERLEGRVVDAQGSPLVGALVHFGELAELRQSGSPYRAYLPESGLAERAARTDADGRYALVGTGGRVTAWHSEHSPLAVDRGAAAEIALPPRTVLAGRIVDAEGRPVADGRVRLDRARETTTDAEGRFRFEDVEAGVHGLSLPGERFLAVLVRPGEVREREIGPGLDEVRVRLERAGEPYRERVGGVVVGEDDDSGLHELVFEDGEGAIRRTVPGRYLYMHRDFLLARGRIERGRPAVFELGDADLRVQGARPGERLYLVPEGAHEGVRHFAERVLGRDVPASGEVRFEPLPRGRYELAAKGRGRLRAVEVDGPGAVVELE